MKCFFVVKSGVVAWEDTTSIAEWNWKTVAVCASDLTRLASVVQELVALRSTPFRRFARVQVGMIPIESGLVAKRLALQSLQKDIAGFGRSRVVTNENHFCVVSELIDASIIDLDHLSSYRKVVLLELDTDKTSLENVYDYISGTIVEFDGATLAELLSRFPATVAARIIDRNSYSVAQVIGPHATSSQFVDMLLHRGVPRIHDVRSLPEEIAKLAT
jgi:hypothetical protein